MHRREFASSWRGCGQTFRKAAFVANDIGRWELETPRRSNPLGRFFVDGFWLSEAPWGTL